MNPYSMRQVSRLSWGGAWGTQQPYCHWEAMTCSKSWKEPWVTWCHSANTRHRWPTDQCGQNPRTESCSAVSLLAAALSARGVGAVKAEKGRQCKEQTRETRILGIGEQEKKGLLKKKSAPSHRKENLQLVTNSVTRKNHCSPHERLGIRHWTPTIWLRIPGKK